MIRFLKGFIHEWNKKTTDIKEPEKAENTGKYEEKEIRYRNERDNGKHKQDIKQISTTALEHNIKQTEKEMWELSLQVQAKQDVLKMLINEYMDREENNGYKK